MRIQRKSLPAANLEAFQKVSLSHHSNISAADLIEVFREGCPENPVDIHMQNARLRQLLLDAFPWVDSLLLEVAACQ